MLFIGIGFVLLALTLCMMSEKHVWTAMVSGFSGLVLAINVPAYFHLPVWVAVAFAIAGVFVAALVANAGWARFLGRLAIALTDIDPVGEMVIHGRRMMVRSDHPITKGACVCVTDVSGRMPTVEEVKDSEE